MEFPKGWHNELTEAEIEAIKKQREQEEVLDLICSLGSWFYGFILKVFLVVNLGIVTAICLKSAHAIFF